MSLLGHAVSVESRIARIERTMPALSEGIAVLLEPLADAPESDWENYRTAEAEAVQKGQRILRVVFVEPGMLATGQAGD